MTTYGYVRVSTREQNENRQLIVMCDFGIQEKTSLLTSNQARTLTIRPTRSS